MKGDVERKDRRDGGTRYSGAMSPDSPEHIARNPRHAHNSAEPLGSSPIVSNVMNVAMPFEMLPYWNGDPGMVTRE